jgi:hypothetical protein
MIDEMRKRALMTSQRRLAPRDVTSGELGQRRGLHELARTRRHIILFCRMASALSMDMEEIVLVDKGYLCARLPWSEQE